MRSGDNSSMATQRAQLADVLARASEVRVTGTNDGVVTTLSPTVTTQLGWLPEEMCGRPIADFVHPDDRDTLAETQAHLVAGRPQQVELRLRRVDGTHAQMAISMHPVLDHDGTVVGRAGGWRLVDERPWGGEALDERALRFVAEHTSEVLLLVSPDQYLLWSTSAVRDLLGWEPSAMFDRDLETFLHPDDLSAAMPHLEASFRMQDPVAPPKDLIVRLAAAGGGHVWVSMRLAPLADPDGMLVGVVVSLRRVDDLFSSRQQLAAERGRLRATLDSLLDPHVTMAALRDATGRVVDFVITDANRAACEVHHTEPGWLRGRRLSDLSPIAWTNGMFELVVGALDTGQSLVLDDFLYAPDAPTVRRYAVRAVATGDQLTCTWRHVGPSGRATSATRSVKVRRRRR